MKDYFFLSVNNLRRRKLRSWLTMLGIFIGIAAVVALISLGQGLQAAITSEFESFGTDKIIVEAKGVQGPPGSGTSLSAKLTSKDVEAISRVNGVEAVAGTVFKTAKVEFKDEISFNFVYGLPQDPEAKKVVSFFDVDKGRALKQGDKYKAVIGVSYAEGKVFKKKVSIGDKIKIEGVEFEVVGIQEKVGNPFDDSAITIPKDTLKEIYGIKDEESQIYAKVENVDNIDKVKADIEHALRKERNEKEGQETFQVSTSEQILQSFSNVFSIVQAVLVGIAAISLVVGGIGIANTMYTSVLERTKEIGTMKAVGAKNSDILTMFLIESGLLGVVGGLIGVGIGIGLSKGAQYVATLYLGTNLLQASTSLTLILGALLFSFVIGAASGVFPAMQAAKLRPVDALRHE